MTIGEWDELEPLPDHEIEKLLGGKTAESKILGAALKEATAAQKAKAMAFLNKAAKEWIMATQESSIVAYARQNFLRGNYGHPAIARYLQEYSVEIFR